MSIPSLDSTSVLMVDDGIVVQQRFDMETQFNLPWVNYTNGFGNKSGNYWMGLEKLFQLTNASDYNRLKIELCFPNGTLMVAQYDTFYIDDESENYAIHVTGYSGDAGDIMNTYDGGWSTNLNGMQFSTADRGGNAGCASGEGGGWWYNNCDWFNLNGDVYFCVCERPLCDLCPNLSWSRMLVSVVQSGMSSDATFGLL